MFFWLGQQEVGRFLSCFTQSTQDIAKNIGGYRAFFLSQAESAPQNVESVFAPSLRTEMGKGRCVQENIFPSSISNFSSGILQLISVSPNPEIFL